MVETTAKERVQIEYDELNEKMFKLSTFIFTKQMRESISSTQLDLMYSQLDAMKEYARILKLRLEVWDV